MNWDEKMMLVYGFLALFVLPVYFFNYLGVI